MAPENEIAASETSVSPPEGNAPEPQTAARAPDAPSVPAIKPPRKRRGCWTTALGILGIFVVAFAVWLASVAVFDWSETTSFCTTCHVMYPERTAYQVSPHARVDCGTCHVGPGVVPAIQAKLRSAHYLWVYPLKLFERPIPSPITSLRPVEIVCEQCHWPQKVYKDRLAVIPHYAQDEQNSLTQTVLSLKTGGEASQLGLGRGIHWHIANPVYYIATDEKRQEIPWVSAEYNGVVTEYLDTASSYTAENLAKMEKRKMDCVDCHNRASHNFRNPADAIDEAMAMGSLPADLPYLKKVGEEVLGKSYASEAEAAAAIAGVEELYKTQYADVYAQRPEVIQAAVAGLQAIFDRTQFPFMNLAWDSHKNNIGHKDFPGCFRCHDGKHLSADNQAIRLECNLCHTIPQVAGPGQPLPAVSVAPAVAEPASHVSTTWLAEHRYKFDTTCAQCHKVDNPGGSDNSSFCSNSACHATQWKFAGLNAPNIRELSQPPAVPSTGVPNPIPHPIGPTTDCKICHGAEGVRPYPDNHVSFTVDMCTSCHPPTVQELPVTATPAPEATATPGQGGVPSIPHDLAGRDNCLMCHDPQGNVRPAPQNHVGRTVDTCQGCHKAAATGQSQPTPASVAAPRIPHDVEGQNCLTCHDPQGDVRPAPQDHVGRAADTCQTCHQPGE